MQERTVTATTIATTFLLSGAAFAHPGHGTGAGTDALHFLTEPVHAVPIALLALAGVLGRTFWRRRVRR